MADCPKCKKGAPAYMMTFGDMMSLLLTFFVLLLSMAQLDIVKFKTAAGSLRSAFGVQTMEQINADPSGESLIAVEFSQQIILVKLREKLEVLSRAMVDNGDAELIETENGFSLQVNDNGLFVDRNFQIQPEIETVLLQIAASVADIPNLIRVVGLTDPLQPDPSGPFRSNWGLSGAKAAAIVDLFIEKGGIDPHRLQLRGAAGTEPASQARKNSPISANARPSPLQNARVEILISRETRPVFIKPDLATEPAGPGAAKGENVSPSLDSVVAKPPVIVEQNAPPARSGTSGKVPVGY
ncbi:MAG: OmpA family protein [Magnetococcales bacterium]|nr:OmpA family protein [Magnetococcales bacterium]